MASDKWFDWDTSDDSKKGAPDEQVRSTEEVAESSHDDHAQHAHSPQESTYEPSPQDENVAPTDWAPLEPESSQGFDSETPDLDSSDHSLQPSESSLQVEAPAPLSSSPQKTGMMELNTRAISIPQVVNAVRPFHLWIEGQLRPNEKERLLDLLARENFGIREVELDLQLEAGKILLPRISEFAAVLVAQTLREASVTLTLNPSDSVGTAPTTSGAPVPLTVHDSTHSHPAEELPVTTEDQFPGRESASPIDLLVATGLIHEAEWRAENSDAFAKMVESLKRELRYKAHLKKADGLVKFQAQVLNSPFISERDCRIQVSALAVRF